MSGDLLRIEYALRMTADDTATTDPELSAAMKSVANYLEGIENLTDTSVAVLVEAMR